LFTSKFTQDLNTKSNPASASLTNVPSIIRWLVSRQTIYEEESEDEELDNELASQDQRNEMVGTYPDTSEPPPVIESLFQEDSSLQFVGFNGRCNKRLDTCYAFWVGASLDVRISTMKHIYAQTNLCVDARPLRAHK
jgi:geranylgeranyl transferase type-1 subunit beta